MELQRWLGVLQEWHGFAKMCQSVSRVSGQDSGKKRGTSREVEKGEILQWKSTGRKKKTRKPVQETNVVEKEKGNNNKKWSDIKE